MPVTSAVLFANTHRKEFVDQDLAGSSKHKFGYMLNDRNWHGQVQNLL